MAVAVPPIPLTAGNGGAFAGLDLRSNDSIGSFGTVRRADAGISLVGGEVDVLGLRTADISGLVVDYAAVRLPRPIAAPVVGALAVIEMVMRALLSGTQAFVGPALVFGSYATYRSIVTAWRRRRGLVTAV